MDLSPKDPKDQGTPDPSIASALATVTLTLPFLSQASMEEVDKVDTASKKDKSMVNLHYAGVSSKTELVEELNAGLKEKRFERKRDEAVLEEWDEFLTSVLLYASLWVCMCV